MTLIHNNNVIIKIVVAMVVSVAGAVGAVGATANAQELTVASSGGAYTASQVKAYYNPFSQKTGVPVKSALYSGVGIAEVRAQVEANNVSWDVVDAELSDVVRACDEGLLEKINPNILPPAPDGTLAINDFLEGTLHECAIPNIVWSTIFAYDKSKLTIPPKTVADFFDTKKFPGKRGLRKTAKLSLEMALLADGVKAENVYEVLSTPNGVNRAFKKLDSIKEDVIWWEAGAQPPQMLADGEVIMTTAYNGRIFNAAVNENKPFEIVWDGQLYDLELFMIPKGSKNKNLAIEFIKFATDTVRLANQASFISYGPARKSSAKLVGKFHNKDIDMKPHMPTAPQNLKNAVLVNSEFWADNSDQLKERFNAWISK